MRIFACIAIIVVLTPTTGLTQKFQLYSPAQAMKDAKQDVNNEGADTWAWMGFGSAVMLGCFGGMTVMAFSQIATPSPPTHPLMGKSPEYVSMYIRTYEREMKQERLQASFGGCLGGTLVAAVLWSELYDGQQIIIYR